jgi:hypothetical protein
MSDYGKGDGAAAAGAAASAQVCVPPAVPECRRAAQVGFALRRAAEM